MQLCELYPRTMAHYRTSKSQSYVLQTLLGFAAIMPEYHQRHYTQLQTPSLPHIVDQRHMQHIIFPHSLSPKEVPSEIFFV